MAKRDLTTETMVQVTESWLDPKGMRTILSGLPIVSALVAKLEEANADLLARQIPSPGAAAAQIAAIQAAQMKLDAEHDRKMRGAVNLLAALADLASDPAEAQRYLALRDLLCPDGLKGIIKSYTDESGAAKLLRRRLDEAAKKQLGKIAIPGGKLLDAVSDWMAAAEKLGTLENEKNALVQADAPEGIRASDVINARNRWIRVVATLESALEISGADAATITAILMPLRDAEAKAERRKAMSGRAAEVDSAKKAIEGEKELGGDD